MNPEQKKLLENKEVVEEIHRHLWIESEKAGRDIGFEKAAEDWLTRFSGEWLKYHAPTNGDQAGKKTRAKRTTILKTRRASTYV